jgi:hypothetical protein
VSTVAGYDVLDLPLLVPSSPRYSRDGAKEGRERFQRRGGGRESRRELNSREGGGGRGRRKRDEAGWRDRDRNRDRDRDRDREESDPGSAGREYLHLHSSPLSALCSKDSVRHHSDFRCCTVV